MALNKSLHIWGSDFSICTMKFDRMLSKALVDLDSLWVPAFIPSFNKYSRTEYCVPNTNMFTKLESAFMYFVSELKYRI